MDATSDGVFTFITGQVARGETITVAVYETGRSAADPHQWYADGVAISGQTGTSLIITDALEGASISLTVDGSPSVNELANFNPVDRGDLLAWWDATDMDYLKQDTAGTVAVTANGQNVNRWLDRSGNGADLTTASGRTAATLLNTTTRGLGFNQNSTGMVASVTVPVAKSVFFVHEPRGSLENSELFGFSTGAMVDFGTWDRVNRIRIRNGSTDSYSTSGTYNTGQWAIGAVAGDAGATRAYRHGDKIILNASNSLGWSTTSLGVGWAFTHVDRSYQGDLVEMVVFGSKFTDDEVAQVEGYLAHKYGRETWLVSGHPYASDPPVELTAKIHQAPDQPDPAANDGVEFLVTFSHAIDPATFTAGDLTVSGTSGTVTAGPTSVGAATPNQLFTVTVSGTDHGDTVTLGLPDGAVATTSGDTNTTTVVDDQVTRVGGTPGGVDFGLALWLKADGSVYNSGTTPATDGQNIQTWVDESNQSADATNSAGDGQTEPSFSTTNTINFNPTVTFNGHL